MKIDISSIIFSHLSTLKNAQSGRFSIADILIFYGLPILVAFGVYYRAATFNNDIFAQSIAVFSIFSALLFSVQVALFGIYTKRREEPDEFGQAFAHERLLARRELIAETNSNISYLVVVSAVSVTIFLTAFILKTSDRYEPSIAAFLYSHFMLTLLMVIKRIHALFDKEYRTD